MTPEMIEYILLIQTSRWCQSYLISQKSKNQEQSLDSISNLQFSKKTSGHCLFGHPVALIWRPSGLSGIDDADDQCIQLIVLGAKNW